MLRILHLSDLHLHIDQLRDQTIVLDALLRDIKRSVDKHGKYDFVFFTGDLILKGTYNEANKRAVVSSFLLPLIECTGISPDRLILVPGNHDVNLSSQSGLLAQARTSLASDEQVAQYLNEATTSSLATGLEGFNEIVGQIGINASIVLENNHYRAYIFRLDGMSVGIAALNSSWNATGAPSDGDYGKLRIGRKQLDEVVGAIANADIKLALVHHPIAWLTPKDSQCVQRQLHIHFDGFFHGHNHEPCAQASVGSSSMHFVSNAGCMYEHRDYFNGYCSIAYNTLDRSWLISAREYYEARQEFDIAPRFAKNGEATFTRTLNSNSGNLVTLPSDEYIDYANETFNSRLLSAHVSDVAPKKLKSLFVEPLLSKVSQRKLDAAGKNGNTDLFIPLAKILSTHRAVIFLGNRDIGKTTLLHRICQLSLELCVGDMPPFGAYINLDVAGVTRAALVEAVVSFGGGAYRKSEILPLLERGEMAVCFDNVDQSNIKQFGAVKDFCSIYPRCRYYFTMLEDVDYSLSASQVPRPSPDAEVFYFHPFGRKETRLLTQNWFCESSDECAKRVDDILSLLGRLNVPRSPFLISALLWIQEKGTQFAPVNQAEILDALIDGVMEKLYETKDRSRIDSTIKRHYLAALAEHLHGTGVKRIPVLELERFTVDYFESRGLPASTGPFLTELKGKGILLETGREVVFMFEAIRAFFLSTRLHENDELLKIALSKEHFLEFGEELDYYTGRHRDQDHVLRGALAIVGELLSDASLDFHLADFDRIRIGRAPVIDADSQRKLHSATLHPPTSDQRNAILESVDEQIRCESAADFRAYANSAIGRYLAALQVASAILRNSELVRNVALKETAYDELASGWCRILISVMELLESENDDEVLQTLDEKRRDPVVRFLEGMLPSDQPGMALYLKKLVIPNVIISLALESIGTAKLQSIVEKHNQASKSTVQRVFDCFIMADLRSPDWTQRIASLLNDFHKNRFVCELVFSKLFQISMLGRLSGHEEHKVKGVMAEALTYVIGETRGRRKAQVKGNFLTRLEKKRLSHR